MTDRELLKVAIAVGARLVMEITKVDEDEAIRRFCSAMDVAANYSPSVAPKKATVN